MKCKVCGKRFSAKAKNRYEIVKDPKGLRCLVEDVVVYEAFDCPKCGCQNIVNVREDVAKYCAHAKEFEEVGE